VHPAGKLRGNGLCDHSAHRYSDQVRIPIAERVQQAGRVAGHVAEVVLAPAAPAQDRQRVGRRITHVSGATGIPVVKPRDPKPPADECADELRWPGVQLLSQPGDEHDRRIGGVTELLVAQLDTATDIDDFVVESALGRAGPRHADARSTPLVDFRLDPADRR
jgi:hypothetical protein